MTFLDRMLGRPARKATTGGPYLSALQSGPLLSVLAASPQEKAAKYLAAYKVGWFYKAGRKISIDVAGLALTLAYEDGEGDNGAEVTAQALSLPFESLNPEEQFLRLMERPNPYQTGRQLRQKTQIRLDFAGQAFWYLEGGAGGQLPTGLYGISPARMFPSADKAGNLIGWVMDADGRGGGTPFDVNEILVFQTTTALDDPWTGQGVVEAIYAQVPLTDLMARHTADVLTTGGRLAGMISPKNRTLDEDEYQDVVRAWRNIVSDPNAARRMLVFPEPMEWSAGAASPKEIGIPELSALTRDDILTAFPISPYQLGVPMPGGLNSADLRREDRRDYWETSIHPRAELLEETIQVGLVARYEQAIGRPLDFDVEEPNLDDPELLLEKVGALKALVGAGFDEDESIAAVGLDHISHVSPVMPDPLTATVSDNQKPGIADQIVQPVVGAPAGTAAGGQTMGPKAMKMTAQRAAVVDPAMAGARALLAAFFTDQRHRIITNVTAMWPAQKRSRKVIGDDWWVQADEDAQLSVALSYLYREVARGGLQVVADRLGRVLVKGQWRPIADAIIAKGGGRITEINDTTRAAINEVLAEGARRGYSIAQIVDGVASEGFIGLRDLSLSNGIAAWDEYRAEMIARTETATAYNEAALGGYKSLGVDRVHVYDGDGDDICAPWDGWEGPISDAPEDLGHPNCTRDFAPLV